MFSGLTITTHRGARSFALTDSTNVTIKTKRFEDRADISRVYATGVVNRKTPIILDVTDPVTSLADGILSLRGTTPGGDPIEVDLVLG